MLSIIIFIIVLMFFAILWENLIIEINIFQILCNNLNTIIMII